MAVKDVNNYYNELLSQYLEMKEALKSLEEKATDESSAVLNNQIEMIRKEVDIIKTNYERIAYIMYLLNMPNKKSKKSGYSKAEQKRLNSLNKDNLLNGIKEENNKALNYLNNLKQADNC